MDYNKVSEIIELLKQRNLSLKKRWGQNFLLSPQLRNHLVSLADIRIDDTVWEIGPGIGNLTVLLAEKAGRLTVFEIDYGLVEYLREQFNGRENVQIIPGNFLKTWRGEFERHGRPDTIIGNLPYRSGATMIVKLIRGGCIASKMVFTLQKEVVERMAAGPGSKSYSFFSVITQSAVRVLPDRDIGAGSFFPKPEVMSKIAVCTPSPLRRRIHDVECFYRTVELLFSSRRKTVKHLLGQHPKLDSSKKTGIFEVLRAAGIDPASRAENISVETFIELSNHLSMLGTASAVMDEKHV